MNFIRTKDLGYNPSFVINSYVGGARDYKTLLPLLKQELKKPSSISMVSFGNHGYFENMEINSRKFSVMNKGIDENYLPLMEIPLLSGRNISTTASDKREAVLVNQSFVRAAGLTDPIGQIVLINRGYDSSYKRIAGVFQDYHFSSLREPIKAMMLHIPEWADEAGVFWVKFEKVNQQKALSDLERIFHALVPDAVYEYQFVDEQNAAEYIQERRWQKIINFASLLAFVLCSLGLFGLAHLSTQQRVKEIGIRKVLGASITQIVSLFTSSFLKLVFIAIIISLPVAWIAANKWLENFAYRIEIGWWMLALAALIAILSALVTVSFQVMRAAVLNPVKSLKTE